MLTKKFSHEPDPDRPKNDKATILTDTIQILRDLTDEVNKLKAECAALSEESHEVINATFFVLKAFEIIQVHFS